MKHLIADCIHWINKRRGNYRCLLCGYQYHDGRPGAHLRERHK